MLSVLMLCLLPCALLLDSLFAEPARRWHPVCAMGALATRSEAFWRNVAHKTSLPLSLAGLCAACTVYLPSTLIPFALVSMLNSLALPCAFLASACCLWLCMAPRSLAEHALRVVYALGQDDLKKAQDCVGMLCGRETWRLDEHGVARACTESVAENFTDGVLATLFWAFCGYVLGGFALSAAFAFLQRSANTLDAMWGKKNERYLAFGRYAAYFDDLCNFLPARISLVVISLACCSYSFAQAAQAWQSGLRFHSYHESPNSAWSEAAFAGALSLRLGGPAVYGGQLVQHPWLGWGTALATKEHIQAAIALMQRATLVACLGFTLLLALFG